MAVQKQHDVVVDYGDPAVTQGLSVFDKRFDEVFSYDGDDLGATWHPHGSRFRLWAPTASEAFLVLYRTWDAPEPLKTVPMNRDRQGTWTASLEGDWNGTFYTYRVRVGKDWHEAVDPYAKAVGVNGDRGCILDLRETDPPGWNRTRPPSPNPTDAIVYELHIRDLSAHPDSGIVRKGTFLGLAESGTRGPNGIPTGLDHIAGLGVTHVQLLPIFDFATESVDETAPDKSYNWGYDPKNYQVPEGSYATDPYSPAVRIRELKQCIQALHDRGLRVVMDVVFNHVYDWYLMSFGKLVPGYYYRHRADGTLSNGSLCGNECATERPMVRKFIVDSVLHWAKEYHVDGFRFDLMGLMDIDTMNDIRRRLDERDPSILMIGEGWNMETVLPEEKRAIQKHAPRMPRIGHFNDDLRDAIKGSTFVLGEKGFVSGGNGFEDGIRRGVAGCISYDERIQGFAAEPDQCVNYVECHDNHTLWDKLLLSAGEASESGRSAMHRLATAIVLTSQGIPFLHAGQEFMRTKQLDGNSYRSPIETNWLDWARCAERQADVAYVKSVIALRKRHPAFRLRTAEEIRNHLRFEPSPERCVAFTLRHHAGGDAARHLYVLYNANTAPVKVVLPDLGEWHVHFGQAHVASLDGRNLTVNGIGMVVLAVWDERGSGGSRLSDKNDAGGKTGRSGR